jgi:predicted small metal-binding protein
MVDLGRLVSSPGPADQIKEETVMPQMYARCNNFMSGAISAVGVNCKYMAVGESQQEVLDQVMKHLTEVHHVDGKELENNIKACIFARKTKVFGTRAPDAEHH